MDEPAVDLPEPGDLTEAVAPDDGAAAPVTAREPTRVRCGDQDCELWRRGFDPALVVVIGETIVVLEPMTPEAGATRSVSLTALAARTGAVVWEDRLTIDSQARSGPQGLSRLDDDSFAVTVGTTLHVMAASGSLRWTRSFTEELQAARIGPEGGLLITLRDRAGDGVASEVTAEQGDPPDRPEDLTIVSVDRATGDERWRVGPVTPLISSATHALVRGEQDRVLALDLASGRMRGWPGSTTARLPADPAGLSSRRVDLVGDQLRIIDDADVLSVIDVTTGEVGATATLQVPSGHEVMLAGELVVMAEQTSLGRSDRGAAVRIYRLDDPATPFATFDEAAAPVLLTDQRARRTMLAGLATPRPAPTAAIAVAASDQDETRVTVFGVEGAVRSSTVIQPGPHRDAGCCARLQPGTDPRWLLVEEAATPTLLLLDTHDGRVVHHLDGPIPRDRLLIGQTIVVTDRDDPLGTTRLWWPDAEAEVTGQPLLLSSRPVPLLQTREGLLALDPTVIDPS